MMKDSYKYLIAGHFRGGTRYCYSFLIDRAIRVGHGQYDSDGIVSWCHVGTGKLPWLEEEVRPADKFEKVVHLVRNPLDVISSAASCGPRDPSPKFMRENIPSLPEYDTTIESLLVFYMRSYVAWNQKIEEEYSPGLCARIESVKDDWGEWLEFFGPPLIHDIRPPWMPRIANHSSDHRTWDWEELYNLDAFAAQEVKEMARRYGYV